MRRWLIIFITILIIVAVIVLIQTFSHQPDPSAPATPSATTQPTPTPATVPTTATSLPTRVASYAELLHTIPGLGGVSIQEEKLPLEQSARIPLPYWAYICPRHDLWICHPDAPSATAVDARDSIAVHIAREQIVFVHWVRSGAEHKPLFVTRTAAGHFQLLRKHAAAVKLQRTDYHWDRAVSIGERFIVPTDQGVVLISPADDVSEQYRQLADEPGLVPEIELTPQGFLAWAPASLPGETFHAAWYSNGQWQKLPDDFSGSFLQLICFEDGSVLQIIPESLGKVRLQIAALETAPSDAEKIKQLVARLSDDDAEVRDDAHAQLVSMGPKAWQQLQQLVDSQHGEARVRLQEIISSKTRPALGRFEILQDQLRVIWRLRDGVVFLAEAGVLVRSGSGGDEQVAPAWIVARRGRPIELLPQSLARNLSVGQIELYSDGGEWLVSDAAAGAQLFFGQELFPLTKGKDVRYRKLAGIDRKARVLLAPIDARPYGSDFLLIDSAIADPTPLLPIWTINVEGGEAGWTTDNWPAVKHRGAFALKQQGWDALQGELATSPPTPVTRQGEFGTLTQVPGDVQGSTVWLDDAALELHDAQGKTVRQPRPAELPAGQLDGVVSGQRLYLVHRDGSIASLLITPGQPQPFVLEAVFTQDVPLVGEVRRIWTDPAGRVCIATATSRIIVIFADRKVPPSMMDLIPASELKRARPK